MKKTVCYKTSPAENRPARDSGRRARAIEPPAYGIGFIDRGMTAAAGTRHVLTAQLPALLTSAAGGQVIRRQEKKEDKKDPLAGGLKITGEQALKKPEVKAFYELQLKSLKKLWEEQSAEGQGVLIGFAGLNLGLAVIAWALNPELRGLLSGADVGKPLSWIPYSPIGGFTYKLPEGGKSAFGFSADFSLNPYLELWRKKSPQVPLTSLTFGLTGEGSSVTGGEVDMGFFGGGLKLGAKTFKERSPYPVPVPGSAPGEPPTTLKQGIPGLPSRQTGPAFEVMVTADMLKLFPGLADVL